MRFAHGSFCSVTRKTTPRSVANRVPGVTSERSPKPRTQTFSPKSPGSSVTSSSRPRSSSASCAMRLICRSFGTSTRRRLLTRVGPACRSPRSPYWSTGTSPLTGVLNSSPGAAMQTATTSPATCALTRDTLRGDRAPRRTRGVPLGPTQDDPERVRLRAGIEESFPIDADHHVVRAGQDVRHGRSRAVLREGERDRLARRRLAGEDARDDLLHRAGPHLERETGAAWERGDGDRIR